MHVELNKKIIDKNWKKNLTEGKLKKFRKKIWKKNSENNI